MFTSLGGIAPKCLFAKFRAKSMNLPMISRGKLRGTAGYEFLRPERKKVEMSFAHLKAILKFDRLRLNGPCGANDECFRAATTQNLR